MMIYQLSTCPVRRAVYGLPVTDGVSVGDGDVIGDVIGVVVVLGEVPSSTGHCPACSS